MRAAASNDAQAAMEAPYTEEEAGLFFGALASARNEFSQVTKELAREFGVGPRGPWMVGMIGRQASSPHELAKFLSIGRSLITAELGHLQTAGLIAYERNEKDRRRVSLSLTPRGLELRDRLSRGMTDLMSERFAHRTKSEILACAQLLSEFAQGNQYAPLTTGYAPKE